MESTIDLISSGKIKSDRPHHHVTAPLKPRRLQITFLTLISIIVLLLFLLIPNPSPKQQSPQNPVSRKRILKSAKINHAKGGRHSILVTGAAGFVGTHVAIALKSRGDGVVGFDSFNSYYELSLKKSRKLLLHKYGIHVVQGDINDEGLLKKIFDLGKFTHIMHLAAQAGVRYAMKNPKSYISNNVLGFVSILEAAKNVSNPPIIVWASSSSVYGLNTKVPFSEEDRTDRPASLYAASKKAGEEIAHTYNHIYGLSITGLRFFTVYGPWGRPDMAYFFFTGNILKQRTIKIFQGVKGDDVKRDFTYISDVVDGCLGALDTAKKRKKKEKAELRIYNIGNTKPVSVKEVVMVLEKILKKKAKKKIMKIPANGDVPYTSANISLAELELGFKPKVDIEAGLRRFVKWYVQYYNVPGYGWLVKEEDERSGISSLRLVELTG